MEIKVLCPTCNKQLKAPSTMAGKQAQCPSCKARMLIPQIALPPEEMELATPPPPRTQTPKPTARPTASRPIPPPQPLPPPPAPISNISSLLDEETEYRLSAGPATKKEPPRRPCPTCGEMIAVGAAKCRFCDTIFDPVLRKMQEKKEKKRSYSSDEDDMSAGDWVVAILCDTIGLIAGLVWTLQGKPKGKKMLIVSGIVFAIKFFIGFATQMANQGNLGN